MNGPVVTDVGPEPGRDRRRDYTGAGEDPRGTGAAWPWSRRLAQAALTIAAAAVLALVVAHWAWRWFGPARTVLPLAPELTDDVTPAITATPWFGTPAPAAQASPAPAPSTAPASREVRLLGVVAGAGGAGYALFRIAERGPVLVRRGDEVMPGVTLEAVYADGVRMRDSAGTRELELRSIAPGQNPPATPTAPAARPPLAPAAAAGPAEVLLNPRMGARMSVACTPPGGGSGPVYRLNAELLTGVAARPESFAPAFTTEASGLVVRDGNAFAAMLGMKGGDRLGSANGVPLRGADDVLVAVVRPLLGSQAVRVTGQREGKPLEWILVNAGACPS